MIEPGMEGINTVLRAKRFWRENWTGFSFMAIGVADPLPGLPVMNDLRESIRNCPEPMILKDAAHFVQEWVDPVENGAVAHFGNPF